MALCVGYWSHSVCNAVSTLGLELLELTMKNKILHPTILLILWFLCSATGLAQRSVIRGTVTDLVGTPIVEVTITAEHPNSGRMVRGDTDDQGRFAFIGLHLGMWMFTAERRGYQSTQAFVPIRRMSDGGRITLMMEVDPLDPPAPSTGSLAGIRGDELQVSLDIAHELFDAGDYDGAISAYEDLLGKIPTLTSLNLQIGHSYREKQDYQNAVAAYRKIPTDSFAAAEAEFAISEINNIGNVR